MAVRTAEGQPIPHTHHLPHPKFLIGTAALLALLGYYGLSRNGQPNTDQQSVPQTNGQDVPPPAGSGSDGEPPKLPAVVAPPTPDTPAETKSAPNPELQPFNNGLVSPKAYTKAEYITWKIPGGGVTGGIGLTLEAGEEFRIPENMQVATTELTRGGKPAGNRIVATRKDGRQINILGNITPVNLTNVGRDLSAGTVVGTSIGSESTFIDKYTQVLDLSAEDLAGLFPDQTKIPPKFIADTSQPQPTNQPNNQNQGVKFHDVKPPQ